MEKPHLTETVPEPDTAEHALQRERVRASVLAVAGEPASHQPQETKPALFNRIASPGAKPS